MTDQSTNDRREAMAAALWKANPHNGGQPWDSIGMRRYSGTSDVREMFLGFADAALAQDDRDLQIETLRRALAWHGDPQRMATTREEWQQEIDDAIAWVKANPEPGRLSFSSFNAPTPTIPAGMVAEDDEPAAWAVAAHRAATEAYAQHMGDPDGKDDLRAANEAAARAIEQHAVAALAAAPKQTERQGVERDRFANDEAAKALYDTWRDYPGWVPWVERGNSTMQERARREVTL